MIYSKNRNSAEKNAKSIKILTKRPKILLGIICIFILIGIIMAGLWPFNFHVKNRVEWIENKNGIHFFGRGIIYSSGLFSEEKPSAIEADEITVEIWLEPDDMSRNLAHFLTFFDSEGAEYFTLAQWTTHLVVISNGDVKERKKNLMSKLGVKDVLFAGKKHFVTVTGNKKRTVVFIDGNRKRSVRHFLLFDENRRLSPQFILGSSLSGKSPWLGSILGLAIYHRALSKEDVFESYQRWLDQGSPDTSGKMGPSELYAFDEHVGTLVKNKISGKDNLIIPQKYRIFRKSILEPPEKNIQPNQKDILINILGFIPLGFFFLAYLSRSTRLPGYTLLILTILLGGGLSLAIELLQVFLPTRISGLSDLMCNSLGTVIGLTLYVMGSHLRKIYSP